MQRHVRFLAVSTILALVAGAQPLAAQTSTVRCESSNNQRAQCTIRPGARVTLSRQVSSTPCREGATWGVGQGFIWVTGGCRAEFAVAYAVIVPPAQSGLATESQLRACQSEADRRLPQYRYDQIRVVAAGSQAGAARVRWMAGDASGLCTVSTTGRILQFTMRDEGPGDGIGGGGPVVTSITCESPGGQRKECAIPIGAQVRLARQLSVNACRPNDTYGTGDRYIWVAKGCRGEFAVTSPAVQPVPVQPQPPVGPPTTTRVVCQAVGNTQRICPIPAGGTVRLVRVLSTQPCREGMTYGSAPSHIWVNNGCSAEFEVTTGGYPGGPGQAQNITCESSDFHRTQCPIRTGVQIVNLVRQIGSTPCVRNSNWGTGNGVIWVDKGCRGEFQIR